MLLWGEGVGELKYRAGHCRQEYPVAGRKEEGPIYYPGLP
jgi:hypothetical protein